MTTSALSASQQVQALRFSSITQKTQHVEDQNPENPQNQRKLNLSLSFRDLTSSRPEFSRLVDYQSKDQHKLDELRTHLTYGEKSDVTLDMVKKSKKTSKLLPRKVTFTTQKKDVLHFSQTIHNKSYLTPKVYYSETKAQYDLKMKDATTAIQKKKILPWAANDAGDFRISFVRRPGTSQDPTPDSAFYFKNQFEFEKAKNYFKSIELLEGRKDFYSQNGLLDRLDKGFKGFFAARMRYLIGLHAKQMKTEHRFRKEDAVHRSVRYFNKLQRDNVKGFVDYWKKLATGLDNQKQTEQKSIKNRQEHILQTVQRVSILRDLDSYLVGAILEAWKNEAEERIESPKQDITLYFETLELTGLIVQPVMKVEILIGNQYPVELIVNQKTIPKTNDMILDYDLNCKLKGLKNNSVFYWKLSHKPGVKDSEQSSEDFFVIHFEDFLIEHLDNVQVKINIFDESATKKAYHYASLRNFYEARKGNNIWLCLDKSQDIDKFPLLQMKVDAGFVDKAHRTYNIGPFIPPAYSKDSITDPFYNYEFAIPTITPKHEKFLNLLPQRWNIIDEKVKELKRTGKLGDFVQTIKTRFAKHYYETSAKQIARLKKTAYLWAELQEELIMNNYKPIKNKANNDNSQLCVDEKYINNLEGLQRPIIEEGHDDDSRFEQHDELNDIVSYLFKRDKWESRKEWKYYYTKLQELCRKGIPPQTRLSLWSELGRVVYFINLTKNEHKKHRAFQLYSKANYGSEKDLHASHDENLAERSQRVYERLKSDAEREYVFLYQELEEDLEILRADLGLEKRQRIPHEQHIRDICRTFIYWAKLFSDPGRGEKVKYYVVYSRAILVLCHGLITCQTCNYLEREVDVQEDQIFWLLISMASYIVSSYFETNEAPVSVDKLTIKETDTTPVNRAKNKITNSGLRCSQLKGIKCDLLILKILLKENEGELYNKFEELGLPLEYYFAEHMLTLFINLFNPGLTFRVWDILFFEGSSANQVRCNRMMVCFLYVLLRECKPMLLKAKNAVDIKFIIETYARFQTRHGAFIREAYKVAQVHFEQTLPDNEKVLDKLSYIKYALFTLKYNILDNKVNAIEKTIQENYFSLTLRQNMVVFNLANNKYSYKPHGQLETLTYAVLAKMIKDFQGSYGTKQLLSQAIGLSLKNFLTADTRQPNINQSPQGNKPFISGLSPMGGFGTNNVQPGGHNLNSGYDDRHDGRNSYRANINPNEGFEPRNSYGGDLNNSQYRNSPGRVNVNAGTNLNANYGGPNDLNANNMNRSSPLRNQSPSGTRGQIFQNQQGQFGQPLGQSLGQTQGQGQFGQPLNQTQGQFGQPLGQGQTQGQGQFYQGQGQTQGQFLQGQGQFGQPMDGRASYDPNRSPLRQQLQEVTVDPRKFLKGKINHINVKIHKLILYSPNLNTLALYVIYGKEKVKKQDFSTLEIDFDATFNLNNVKEATRFINIEIYDEKDPKNPQKIKYLNIDLKRIVLDTPTKLNLKFKEENPYIYNDNFITSEIEMTVLLNGPGFKTGANYSNFPVVPELENHIYDHFRDMRLGEDIPQTVLENDPHQHTATPFVSPHAFSQNRYAWKENFAVGFDEFISIIKNIAPFWLANTNFREIFEAIKTANRNGTFYITDFFILLILCGKFTSTQKFRLLFDLLTGFDDAIPDSKNEMPMHTMRGLCAHIYNLFMLYMPYNELENLVDLATNGNLPAIKKVIINDKTSANTDQTKQFLNRLANYIHLNFNTREIHLYHPQILSLLREYYEKEILTAASTRSFANNKVEITYITNGMAHKIKIETDSNWNIIGDPKIARGTANAQPKVLDLYKHVIALQNNPTIFDRNQFIKVMQKLPLLNYLCSLEHSEVSNVLTELGSNIRFTIFMRGEPVYTAIPSIEEINHKHVLDDPSKKLKKFSSLIRDWDDVVKTCSNTQTQPSNRYRGDNRNAARRYAIEARKLPATKLNIFFSYDHIIAYLKRNVIKTISNVVDKQQVNAADQFNASLFNKNLYDLEYNVSLNIDNERDIKVSDKTKSPFKTLIEKIEAQGSNKEIRNLEVMFNLDEKTMKETFAENYDQLALYRYADGSTEWLPCKLRYKFQYLKNMSRVMGNISDDKIDGFGVIFARYPEETIVKRKADVAIIQQVDFVELESRQVDPATMKAVVVTGNQYAQVELDKRRTVKSFDTGVFKGKGAIRKRYNASDFDEGDGRLPIKPTTWDFISDDAHKIVKKADTGLYKGASRRNYNASDLLVDDGKIKRLATQKDDVRKIKRGQPGQFRGLKRANYFAGDLVEENYKFAKDTPSTPPQSKNALQRGATNNAKRVVMKGEPGKFKGREKDHFHAGDLEDEFPIQNQTSLHPRDVRVSGGQYGYSESPQRRSANYEQQLKKSGSPGIYQGMERRSHNAGDFDEIDENVRGGFDVRQKDYNTANLNQGYGNPYDRIPNDQNYYDNRDLRGSQSGNTQNYYDNRDLRGSQSGNAPNYYDNRDLRGSQSGNAQNYSSPYQNASSGINQGKRAFNSGLPEDNQYRDDNRYDSRDQRSQYGNYDSRGQNVYDRDQGNYPSNYREDENMFGSKQTGIFGTKSHQVNSGYQSTYQQDRYQSTNTRGGYAAETDEISGKVSFNR